MVPGVHRGLVNLPLYCLQKAEVFFPSTSAQLSPSLSTDSAMTDNVNQGENHSENLFIMPLGKERKKRRKKLSTICVLKGKIF